MSNEPTNKEVLEAVQQSKKDVLEAVQRSQVDVLEVVHEFATHVDKRFDRVEVRLDRVEGRLDKVEGRLTNVEASMVTKAYLDDKLADEGVRYGSLIRQTNEKIGALADELVTASSISPSTAKRVTGSEPFARRT